MGLFDNMMLGLETALSYHTLLMCFVGVFVGTMTGVLPGIGPLSAIAMLLPITYHLEPTGAIVMLAGIYYGAQYGGSTASILLNLPGTPATAVTCLDGYPMTQKGRAGVALFMNTFASFIGGSIGIIIITTAAPVVANWALAFGPPEYAVMMLLGLVASATLAKGSPIKGIAMAALGLLLAMVGTDINSGAMRYTLGFWELANGFSLVAMAMGMFGVSEVIASIRSGGMEHGKAQTVTLRSMVPDRDDLKRSVAPIGRGSMIGSALGILPGTGTTIASFMSYMVEKRVSRTPERFGHGAVEGIVGPESANNSAAQTAFIPTLTLGIPGDAIMALVLGALMIHGINPGPGLLTEHPSLFWGLVMSFWIGNVLLVIMNIPMIGLWVRFLQIPYRILYPAILLFICVGVYTVNNSAFDVGLVVMFGTMGYLMRLFGYEPAPLLVAFVLGPMIEENMVRTLLLSRGSFTVFLERPISLVFVILIAALLVWQITTLVKGPRRERRA